MGSLITLKTDDKCILIDYNETFNNDTLNSLKSIVIKRSLSTNSFILGVYKYISNQNNTNLICAYKGDILFDDSFKINSDVNFEEFKEENYQKFKKLLIIK